MDSILKIRNRIFILFLGLLLVTDGESQIIPFRNYSIREGLPQNSVVAVFQDSKGYLWFGTQVGIARFDGKSFRNYNISSGLCGNTVTSILEDKKGQLWIASHDGGVSVRKKEVFYTLNKDSGLVSNDIKSLYLDSENSVWCLSESGISVISSNGITSFTDQNGLPHNNILAWFEDSKKRIWVGTQNGVAVYDGEKWTSFTTEVAYQIEGRIESVVWAIAEDEKGKIWIGTQGGGVFVYDGKNFRHFTQKDGLSGNYVLSMAQAPDKTLWMGHFRQGLTHFDGEKFHAYATTLIPNDYILGIQFDHRGRIWARTLQSGVVTGTPGQFRILGKPNGLIDDRVQDICIDGSGNIWIGTLGGVSMYGKGIFEIYNTSCGLPDNNIVSVACTHDQNVWLGTYNELVRLQGNRITVFPQTRGLYESVILSLFEDSRHQLWIGSYGSLVKRTAGSMVKIKADELYHGDNGIYSLSEDKNGNLWLATESGAWKFDGKSLVRFGLQEGLSGENVKKILPDGRNNLWFVTTEGLTVKTPHRIQTFTARNGLPSDACTDIAAAGDSLFWIGTEGGLVEIVPAADTFRIRKVYSLQNGLASNTIYLLLFDRQKSLWIGHEKGLNRIDILTQKIFYYGASDGFLPVETNLNAVSMDARNHIWFGTVGGAVEYFPENDILASDAPKTYITGIRLSGTDVPIGNYIRQVDSLTGLPLDLKLPYNRSSLIFDFVGLHYTIPEKVKYQYKLDGYDEQWSEPVTQNFAEYKKLPNGHYRFLVKACNSDGIWNPEPVSFSFQIKPPFWKTPWFVLIVVALGVAVIVEIIRYRERKLQEDKRILEQKVRERTAQIEQQKKEIEEKNEELQQQQLEILAQRDEIERQRDIATQQRDQIALQKKEITDSIHYASRIQSAIIPSRETVLSVLPEHFILFMPRDIVSGDFYWVTKHDNRIVIAATDCTGHGVPGAFMSMLGVTLLNEIVNKEDTFQASLILDKLRENVKITLSQTGKEDEAKDGMDIALCVADTQNHTMQFAGANNPLYIIREGELIEYKGDNMPIGIHAGEERPFTNHIIDVKPGDRFYIFSDGFADQFGGPEGSKFKAKPFKRLLQQIHSYPMEKQHELLLDAFLQWKGNLDQVDDVLVIGFCLK
ncbi:MAG: SpoIIE family protein phosphatase [Bacteroidales bacterium]|nr:SpoIIE family protein phosphatase [Bacteroidales bacterium]